MTERGIGEFLLSADVGSNLVAAEQFLKRLVRYQIRATWGCSDLSSGFVQELAQRDQAVALLVDGAGQDRSWLADELARQLQNAQEVGVEVRTLAVANPIVTKNLDLLVRHHIRAVRVPAHSPALQSGSTRYGIALAQPDLVLGDNGSWTTNRWTVRRSVKRAVFNRGLLHVQLNLNQLGNTPVARNFNHVMDGVEKQLESGKLKSVTLADLATKLPAQRRRGGSILRAA